MNVKKIGAIASIILGVILLVMRIGFFWIVFGLILIGAGVVLLITSKNAPQTNAAKYIASQNAKVFHRPSCNAVKMMSPGNRIVYGSDVTYDRLIEIGMKPCDKCNPRR
jgi:hypothetical protein